MTASAMLSGPPKGNNDGHMSQSIHGSMQQRSHHRFIRDAHLTTNHETNLTRTVIPVCKTINFVIC